MIGRNSQDEQTESRDSMVYSGTFQDNTSKPTQVNYPQVDMYKLEKNIVSKVKTEVDNVITSVEARIQDAVLTAIETLVITREKLAVKSANASSGRLC